MFYLSSLYFASVAFGFLKVDQVSVVDLHLIGVDEIYGGVFSTPRCLGLV